MAAEVLRLKVTLRDSEPEIWRQVEVVSTNTLAQLHRVLQVAMGWTDSHLHQYWQGDRCFGMADPELGLEGEDERRVRLDTLFRHPGDQLVYEYDFGDGWEHDIVLEGVGPISGDEPRVCNGRGTCPPEDVGGVSGFEEFLDALANPQHERHREFLDWHGPFKPDAFSVEAANRALRGRSRKRTDAYQSNGADTRSVSRRGRGSFATLIWLDSVNWADRSRPHRCEFLSQHALAVLVICQVHLVGGTAF